jgi:hypothetical protein
MGLGMFFFIICYIHVAPMGLLRLSVSLNQGFFRPYRARNIFSIYDATNLLPLRGCYDHLLPTCLLAIGYWLLVIDLKNNLYPDSPIAPCSLPLALCSKSYICAQS